MSGLVEELGSDLFFEKWYPETKESTRDIYRRLIADLQMYLTVHGDGVAGWLEEKNGNAQRWKERFLFLRKLNGVYWDFDVCKYNEEYVRIVESLNLGKNLSVKETNMDDNLLLEFEKLDRLFALERKRPVRIEMLFGCWLPPRRLDVYSLVVRKSATSEAINYYDQSRNLFVFNEYKNAKSKGCTEFSIMALSPLYENKEMLFQVVRFMNSLPVGKIYRWKSMHTMVQKWYGVPTNTLRKYWVTKMNNGSKEQKLILCKWMDHSLERAVKSYIVEKSEVSDNDDEIFNGGDPQPLMVPSKISKTSDLIDFSQFNYFAFCKP